MKVYLYSFTSTIDDYYVTNDNYPHFVSGITYIATAIDSKEIVFDLKEIVGEVNLSIPWVQAGFLKDHFQAPFDAPVQLDITSYDLDAGTTTLTFTGFINAYKVNQNTVELGCLSFIEQARDNFPRMVVTRLCNQQLYSPLCTAVASSYTRAGTLLSVDSTRLSCYVGDVTEESSWFQYGYVYSGGSYRYITASSLTNFIVGGATVSAQYLEVMHPLPAGWTINMSLNLVAGCDKKMQTCDNKFSNFPDHYLGFPHAPYESIHLTGLKSTETEMHTSKKK